MTKITETIVLTEQIPDDLPEWAIKAMAEGQLFKVTFDRIASIADSIEAMLSEPEHCWDAHIPNLRKWLDEHQEDDKPLNMGDMNPIPGVQ